MIIFYSLKNYLACEDGFFGNNCAFKCPYPTFGKDCLSLCLCKFQNCDHANGCIQLSKSKIPQQLSIKMTFVEVHIHSITNESNQYSKRKSIILHFFINK